MTPFADAKHRVSPIVEQELRTHPEGRGMREVVARVFMGHGNLGEGIDTAMVRTVIRQMERDGVVSISDDGDVRLQTAQQ